jgi:hypothetical protein
MPIRFRCPQCKQLLGISRRKAGTSVGCPTCHAQVTVPGSATHGATATADGPAEAAAASRPEPLFEQSDFDALLRAPAPPPVPAPSHSAAPGCSYDVEPLDPAVLVGRPARPGIFLSPAQATVLTVAAVVLLTLAFVAGLLVGRFAF